MKRLSDFDKFAYLLLPLILHVAIREMQKYKILRTKYDTTNICYDVVFAFF